MKNLNLLFVLFLFFSCSNKPNSSNDNEQEKSLNEHFHSCAIYDNNKEILITTIKVPDQIAKNPIRLKTVSKIGRVITTSKDDNVPNVNRVEILLADLIFEKSDKNEDIYDIDIKGENIRWEKECKELIIKTKLSKEDREKVDVASIKMPEIKGIKQIVFGKGHNHDKKTQECIEKYNKCYEKNDKQEMGMGLNLFFFHPGHNLGDPRSGFDGIDIGGN